MFFFDVSDNIAFTLYSTFGAFYLPFLILIIIYLRMFTLAKRRWANRRTALPLTPSAARKVTTVVTTGESSVVKINDGKNFRIGENFKKCLWFKSCSCLIFFALRNTNNGPTGLSSKMQRLHFDVKIQRPGPCE